MGSRLPPLIVATLLTLTGACADNDDGAAATTTTDAATSTSAAPTSTTATATSTAEGTTTTDDPAATIVLRGDGLSVVALGATPDAAVAAVTAALGPPTADTGWQSSFSAYGTCPGEQVRGVEWDHLVLLFSDGETAYGRGEHLFAWRITGAPPALGTARGFGYHASATDAEELYPGAVEVVEADDPFPGFLQVAAEGGLITAFLDDADVVTNLEAGAPCGE